jgi:hypothetical protein
MLRNIKREAKSMFVMSSLVLSFVSNIAMAGDAYENEWEKVKTDNSSGNVAPTAKDVKLDKEQAKEAEKLNAESATHVRRFHEVLDELFAEFGYDVRMGQLNGLKNLAIRKVEVSDAIPHTYTSYVEVLVDERIRDNSRVKLISCTTCKTKVSQLVAGKLLVTSPTTNMAQMRLAADQLGIENFMDVVLVYHSTHMVLAMQIFNSATNELAWTRTYNSETIKSRYQKLAIDYSQVEKSRPGEDYVPEYRFLLGLGGAIIPNVSGDSDDSSMASVMIRSAEKFNNRKQEFGLHLSIFLSKSTFVKEHAAESSDSSAALAEGESDSDKAPTAFKTAIGLYGIFAHNFIGALESYNKIRHALNLGIGVLLAPSYLAGSLRGGWNAYFGKRYVTDFGLYYVLPSKVLIGDTMKQVDGGIGLEICLAINI